jgi:hypothetical protein
MPTLHLPDSVRTGGIILPDSARSEIERDHRELADNLFSVAAVKADFDRDLKQIDPHLEIVKAKDQTTVVGLRAGFWHLVRRPPGHPAYIKPITANGHPEGPYKEPDSSVFEEAMLDDLWNDRARKANRKRMKTAEDARQRRKDREAQDRIAEFGERVKSRNSTQILVRSKPA